jgi:hypothetical protein
MGIEPTASPLPRECSTDELQEHYLTFTNRATQSVINFLTRSNLFKIKLTVVKITLCNTSNLKAPKNWSGRRDSNPRPSAWKADALAN